MSFHLFFCFYLIKPNLRHRATVFSLGNRDCVLKQELEAPIIVPHAQQKAETKVKQNFQSFELKSCILFPLVSI